MRRALDALLWRKKSTHRLGVHVRSCGPFESGIDATIRAYCALRKIPYQIEPPHRDLWGIEAEYRRDLASIARAHAVVWFGPCEGPNSVVNLAILLGVDYRIVPLPLWSAAEEEGV